MALFNSCYLLVEKFSAGVNTLAKSMIIVFLAVMTTTTSLQIFFRYILNSSLSWPEELNVFLMAWVTFVGSSIALRNMEHIGIEMFVGMLPKPLSRVVNLCAKLAVVLFLIMLIKYGLNVALISLDTSSSALVISMFWPRISLVVGGLMMLIQAIYLIMRDLRSILIGEEV